MRREVIAYYQSIKAPETLAGQIRPPRRRSPLAAILSAAATLLLVVVLGFSLAARTPDVSLSLQRATRPIGLGFGEEVTLELRLETDEAVTLSVEAGALHAGTESGTSLSSGEATIYWKLPADSLPQTLSIETERGVLRYRLEYDGAEWVLTRCP